MTERKLATEVIRYLRQRRAAGDPLWWLKVVGSPVQHRGIPDLLIVRGGRLICVELKIRRSNKLTPLQLETIRQLRTAGARAEVCRSLDDVIRLIDADDPGLLDGGGRGG